jgi:hypothetical protein
MIRRCNAHCRRVHRTVAGAHHSSSHFDNKKPVSISCKVTQYERAIPQLLHIKVWTERQTQEYICNPRGHAAHPQRHYARDAQARHAASSRWIAVPQRRTVLLQQCASRMDAR